MQKFVTVFGSSVPRPGDEEYETAYLLGKKLAAAGLNICTGGFLGIMEAVSKGAVEYGSQVVGVTLDIYNVPPNKYLTKEIKTDSLAKRLNHLIEIGNAYVVLQGGTGTLVELALVWEYINKNMLQPKPFACHGSMWNRIVEIMEAQIAKEKRQTGLIQPFDDIEILADFVINSLKSNFPK